MVARHLSTLPDRRLNKPAFFLGKACGRCDEAVNASGCHTCGVVRRVNQWPGRTLWLGPMNPAGRRHMLFDKARAMTMAPLIARTRSGLPQPGPAQAACAGLAARRAVA